MRFLFPEAHAKYGDGSASAWHSALEASVDFGRGFVRSAVIEDLVAAVEWPSAAIPRSVEEEEEGIGLFAVPSSLTLSYSSVTNSPAPKESSKRLERSQGTGEKAAVSRRLHCRLRLLPFFLAVLKGCSSVEKAEEVALSSESGGSLVMDHLFGVVRVKELITKECAVAASRYSTSKRESGGAKGQKPFLELEPDERKQAISSSTTLLRSFLEVRSPAVQRVSDAFSYLPFLHLFLLSL